MTSSPSCLPIAERVSALIGNIWTPSPMAMNDARNGCPSMVPRTLTRPRVPKYSADSGHTTYVQPPFVGFVRSVAVNCLSNALMPHTVETCFVRWGRVEDRAEPAPNTVTNGTAPDPTAVR